MQQISYYQSPLGKMLIAADDIGICGIWFEDQKFYAAKLNQDYIELENEDIIQAKKWLDIYFSGKQPDFTPKLHLVGTNFQLDVWNILLKIPYGKTTTYGNISQELVLKYHKEHMSAQAVGNAVGRNPISIIVPCHRVIGANGKLTGYAGGLDKKSKLLALEKLEYSL